MKKYVGGYSKQHWSELQKKKEKEKEKKKGREEGGKKKILPYSNQKGTG